jgi:hypothetical protein
LHVVEAIFGGVWRAPVRLMDKADLGKQRVGTYPEASRELEQRVDEGSWEYSRLSAELEKVGLWSGPDPSIEPAAHAGRDSGAAAGYVP